MATLAEQAYLTERCTCKALRSEHNDTPFGARGHGGIPRKCQKYTWDGKSGPYSFNKDTRAEQKAERLS